MKAFHYPRLLCCYLVLGVYIIACKDEPAPSLPVITSFDPASAFAGEQVVIVGKNFAPDLTKNAIAFNGVNAAILSGTSTQLVAVVPDNATTGKITVTANHATATSFSDFTVLRTSIGNFTPAAGIAGTTVTITGENFSGSSANNVVKFNGTAALVSASSATSLTVTVPDGATSGKITIETNNQSIVSSSDFTVLQTAITGFSPLAATVQEEVTITGSNFSPTPSLNIVKFGDSPATVTSATETSIKVIVPGNAMTGKISVTIYGKTTFSGNDFTLLLPSIENFSPQTGVAGIVVTINGSNFSSIAEENVVHVGQSEAVAEILSAGANQLTIKVPEDAYTGKISVTSKGKKVTSTDGFTLGTINIENFNPEIGLPSHEVIITGTNFSPVAALNKVTFNGAPATVTSASPHTLTVIVPEGASGEINVRVTVGQAPHVAGISYTICDSNAELIFGEIVITAVAADKKTFNCSFTVKNLGGVPADLSLVRLIGRVRKTFDGNGEPVASMPIVVDEMLNAGAMLGSGETYTHQFTADVTPDTVTEHPYLALVMGGTASGAIVECDYGNNVQVRKIEE